MKNNHFRRIAPLVVAFALGVITGTPTGQDPVAHVATEVEAAQLTITIPNAAVPLAVAAIERRFDRLPGETNQDFFERWFKREVLKPMVLDHVRFVSQEAAPAPQTITDADLGITP